MLAQFELEFGPNVRGDVKLLDVVGFLERCYRDECVFGDGEASSEESRASGKVTDGGGSREGEKR